MCHNVLSAVLAGLLDEKVFPLRLSSLGGKSLFRPAGSLASATANSFFWRCLPVHAFTGWESPPIGLSSVPMPSEAYQPSKTGKGYPGASTCPQHENKCQELGFLASACSQRRAQSSVSVPRRLTTNIIVLTVKQRIETIKRNTKS